MRRNARPLKITNVTELAARRGAGNAPTLVELSDHLTVGVKLMNVATMFALGLLPEPLMEAAMNISKKSANERGVVDIKESAALQDAVCKALIRQPEYADLDEVAANANEIPAGKLALGMLSDDEIAGVFHLIYKGIESWESFREEQLQRDNAVGDGTSAGEDAEPDNLTRLEYTDVGGA